MGTLVRGCAGGQRRWWPAAEIDDTLGIGRSVPRALLARGASHGNGVWWLVVRSAAGGVLG